MSKPTHGGTKSILTELKTSGIPHYHDSYNSFRLSNETFLGTLRNTLEIVKAFRCSVKSDSTLRESLQGSVICHTLTNKLDGSLSLGVSWMQGQLLCCFLLKNSRVVQCLLA